MTEAIEVWPDKAKCLSDVHGPGFCNCDFPDIPPPSVVPLEPDSQMQHVAGSVLRRGSAHANEYGAELVVIAIEREPKPEAVLEGLPAPGYAFGIASTSDDDETIALALRAIASRLERA